MSARGKALLNKKHMVVEDIVDIVVLILIVVVLVIVVVDLDVDVVVVVVDLNDTEGSGMMIGQHTSPGNHIAVEVEVKEGEKKGVVEPCHGVEGQANYTRGSHFHEQMVPGVVNPQTTGWQKGGMPEAG